jgi:hypothetical protein
MGTRQPAFIYLVLEVLRMGATLESFGSVGPCVNVTSVLLQYKAKDF